MPQAVIAQAQLGMLAPSSDGTITIQGSDGNPVKIPQAALASAPSLVPQMAGGISTKADSLLKFHCNWLRIVNNTLFKIKLQAQTCTK